MSKGARPGGLLLAYLLVRLVEVLATRQMVARRHPALPGEQPEPGASGHGPFNLSAILFDLSSKLHYALAILDLARTRGAGSLAFSLRVVGLAGFAASNGLLFWARYVNRFYTPEVRVQEERGHHTVTGGPYRFVRHPGYLASILRTLCSGLALGSWLSLIPGALSIPLTIYWTALEDEALRGGLRGYAAYARRVRYRLAPGLW